MKDNIENRRVWLRPMTDADTAKIVAWRNKDFVRRNFIYQELFTEQSHREWIKNQIEPGHAVQFVIVRHDGAEIGSVYFRDIDWEEKTAEYGIFIGEEKAIGRGYGSETACAALAYAFGTMGLEKVFLRFLSDNIGARKSYEHAGFRMTDRRERVSTMQGEREALFMEIDKERWMDLGKSVTTGESDRQEGRGENE